MDYPVKKYTKVPLQQTTKTRKTVFAYMRRSTKKDTQANSLFQQGEFIEKIIKNLGIDGSEVKSYVESTSGYENRTRKEWTAMLKEIDKCKEPCILLCKDTSRLSRNEHDNLEIINRLFGKNKFKNNPKIASIYFFDIDNYEVVEWSKSTDQTLVATTLLNNYAFSVNQKKLSGFGITAKLEKGEFPYNAPHGLERVNLAGVKYSSKRDRTEKTVLKTTEKIRFIKRAFEMKAQGRSTQEVCRYLRKYGDISISQNNFPTFIRNTIYIGKYIFNEQEYTLNFWEKEPPISKVLFDKANNNIGTHGFGYGDLQKEHLAIGKIIHEETGNKFSLYKAKGKYNTYGVNITKAGKNGKKNRTSLCKSEKEIIKTFLDEVLEKITNLYTDIKIKYDLMPQEEYFKKGDGNIGLDDNARKNGLYINLYTRYFDIINIEKNIDYILNSDFSGNDFYISHLRIKNKTKGEKPITEILDKVKPLTRQYTKHQRNNILKECNQQWKNMQKYIKTKQDEEWYRETVYGAYNFIQPPFTKGERQRIRELSHIFRFHFLCTILTYYDIKFSEAFGKGDVDINYIRKLILEKNKNNTRQEVKIQKKENHLLFSNIKNYTFEACKHEHNELFILCYNNTVNALKKILDIYGISTDDIKEVKMINTETQEKMIQKWKEIFETNYYVQEEKEKELMYQDKKDDIQQKIQELSQEKKETPRKYAKMGYPMEIAQEEMNEIQKQIDALEVQLQELSENANFEDFLVRLPYITEKLHELADNTLNNEENEEFRSNLQRLMQLTLHELKIDNKKSLKIRLFEGLDAMKKLKK